MIRVVPVHQLGSRTGAAPEGGRRAAVRTGRLSVMARVISDPRVLSVLEHLADSGCADLEQRTGLDPGELGAVMARLASYGLVRRIRNRRSARWCLAGSHVAAWLSQGFEIAGALRRT